MNQPSFAFADADPLTDIIRTNGPVFSAGFLAWLADNRKIWERFEAEANKLWLRGRKHYSARTIIEFMRHETALYEKDCILKINNDNAPDMSRLYMLRYPERHEFFETRRMPGSKREAA